MSNNPNDRTSFESPHAKNQDLLEDSLNRSEAPRDTAFRPDTGPLLTPAPSQEGTMMQTPGAATQGSISLPSMGGPELPPEFELIQEIARGGMGVVYKARQKRLNRVVALKMILPHMLYDNSAVERFYIEARAAAALDHPNIVPIHEVGEYKGQHYFTMAFIEGESLRQRIKRQLFPVREAVKMLIGIADGVGYAHKQGIIHRDMKPDNVLIDQQGRPRITDFGLAKQVASNSGLTATGQVMGTPAYMSPEQALGGKRIIGPQTDVYALGAILYNMLTGETPFDGDTVTEVLCKVISDTAPAIGLKNQDIPESLDRIYQKALAKDPAQRYADAEEFRDALQEWEGSADAAATRPDIRSKTLGDAPFQETLFPSAAGVRSVGSLTSITPPPQPTPPGKPAWLFPVLGVLFVVIGVGAYLIISGGKNDPTKSPEFVDNRNKERVIPKVEVHENQVAMITPSRQDFPLKVEFLAGKAGLDGVWHLKLGEPFACTITAEKDCHVAVWSVNADGTVMQLSPNDWEPDDRLKAGQARTFPGKKAEISPELSNGVDQLRVIASDKPWDPALGGKLEAFTVFKDPKDRQQFQNLTRGLIARPKTDLVAEEVIPFRVEK
jgi:serine/threonine protein kinase